MRRFQNRVWVPLALLLLLAPLTAAQFGGHRGQGRGPGGHPGGEMRLLASLDLSEDQRSEIRDIGEAMRSERRSTVEQLRQARSELQTLIVSGSADETALREAVASISILEADVAVGRAAVWQEIRLVLGADQLEQLDDMIADGLTEGGLGHRGRGRRGDFQRGPRGGR